MEVGLQKRRLQQSLGLELGLEGATSGLIEDSDLEVVRGAREERPSASQLLQEEIAAVTGEPVSSREKNRLKRKAKLEAKAAGRAKEEQKVESKKLRVETVLVAQPQSMAMVVDSVGVEEEEEEEDSGVWPLAAFCQRLVQELFSAQWEARHGAATGLRELVKVHGAAGRRQDLSAAWLEDLVLRLLCVLALDRFGDFVSDSVVAPVRESAAQALGVALPHLQESGVMALADLVLGLVRQEDWEARHGGLLAVKYLLAVRGDLADTLLPRLYPQVFAGLNDSVDDVAAVAASALLPVVPSLVRVLPGQVAALSAQLWAQLEELDDLTSSTQATMSLLAELLSQPSSLALCHTAPSSLPSLVPRLYPFLSHSSSAVRRAALSTLLTLSSSPTLAPSWLPSCAPLLLRHLYQRALLEHQPSLLSLTTHVWGATLQHTPLQPLLIAACPWFGPWLQLIATPDTATLDSSLLLPSTPARQVLGGPQAQGTADQQARAAAVCRARHTGATLLGRLAAYIVRPVAGEEVQGEEPPLQMLLSKVLVPQLATSSALQHLAVSLVVRAWLQEDQRPGMEDTSLPGALLACLAREGGYLELGPGQARLGEDAGDYVASLQQLGLPVASLALPSHLAPPAVHLLVTQQSDFLLAGARLPHLALTALQERRAALALLLEAAVEEEAELQLLTLASVAGAVASLGPSCLPPRLNPVLKPLMEAVKREASEESQTMAAASLARVLAGCRDRQPSPNDKVVRNLCSFLCSDPWTVPPVQLDHLGGALDPRSGILTLHYTERRAELAARVRRGRRRKVAVPEGAAPLLADSGGGEEETAKAEVQRRGAASALGEIARFFGGEVMEQMPALWQGSFSLVTSRDEGGVEPQALINSLEVLRVLAPSLHTSLLPSMQELLPSLLLLTSHPLAATRYMAARVLSAVAQLEPLVVLSAVITSLLPALQDSLSLARRAGALEVLHCLCEELGLQVVPYIVLLIVPVLGTMSDPQAQVRLLATSTFATLVRLLPLDGGLADGKLGGLSQELAEMKERERVFLDQLLNNKKAEQYKLSVPVKAELRSYQVAGVNWLAFLARYRLHGILCDDMGLGKTLQTICVLASDHRDRAEAGETGLQSLVVCPPTLGGHWLEEVAKFVSREHLHPFLYFGSPTVRAGLRSQLARHNLVITSYDIVRNDVELLGSVKWNYLVLDEGHVIKNTKTKTAVAVRQLEARHRLILTGTPIQNSVSELWALFDFLMPGYLGSEKSFAARYGRPILASREAKCGAREQEAGALAMEALHRQTLPFILRRMKEEVLADLPPKITQDYYCHLSPLQLQLYEDFTRAQGAAAKEQGATQHVFQALQYLRKVCCHPRLVLSPEHPEYGELVRDHLRGEASGLLDIGHAAKLVALKQLLVDLGMSGQEDQVVGQHRALVFCQLKAMLDIVESDLLKVHLPDISYLRLDGSVPAGSRHAIVSKFNSDPSIDLLLLSTSVGGLGLNLTGADTVIFVEHDWNPMKDLQAMDRAHRIGQRKVVNVYRLITRDTIEEKIMSLQKFKLHTARTVISSDNSSMASMQTEGVLDLFSLGGGQEPGARQEGGGEGGGVAAVLRSLPELWQESEYTEEYDMEAFIKGIKPT